MLHATHAARGKHKNHHPTRNGQSKDLGCANDVIEVTDQE
jgi:hypothetical protein